MYTFNELPKDIFTVILPYLYSNDKVNFIRQVSKKYRRMFSNTFFHIKTNNLYAPCIRKSFPRAYVSYKPHHTIYRRGMNINKHILKKLGRFNEVKIVNWVHPGVNVSYLKKVSIVHIQGLSVKNISSLKNVYYLDISYTDVEDVSSLSNVAVLIAKHTRISSVRGLNSIKFLDIDSTLVKDVSELHTLDTVIVSKTMLYFYPPIDDHLKNLDDSLNSLCLQPWICNMFDQDQRKFIEDRYRVYQDYITNGILVYSDEVPCSAETI